MQRNEVRARPRQDAFTLAELLVAVAILGVLAAVMGTMVTGGPSRPAAAREELSLVSAVVQLAGLAILLFGAGFWYLVELARPGRLDDFRLGHFLLLALTYSMFFAAFAVLGAEQTEAWLAVTIAAAISYPLLVLHVTAIVGLRFALTSALPLAILTTAVVVLGVYGGASRPFAFLGIVTLAVAHLTWTYPRFSRRQARHREDLATSLQRDADALGPAALRVRQSMTRVRELIATNADEPRSSEHDWLAARMDVARRALEDHESALSLVGTLAQSTRVRHRAVLARARALVDHLAGQLPWIGTALAEALDLAGDEPDGAPAGTPHCTACGHAGEPGDRYCARCATPTAQQRACGECGVVLKVTVTRGTSGSAADAPSEEPTFCAGCGTRHAVPG